MQSKAIRFLQLALLTTGLTLLPGCSLMGYRLGSMLPPDIKSVYVPTFINKTIEPLLEVDTTRAAIEEIQKEGSLQVSRTKADADTILTVTLLDYALVPLDFQKGVVKSATEYRAIVTASLIMTRRATDKVIAQHPAVQGQATFVVAGDLTTSKKTALPALAEDLAHQLIEQVTEAWVDPNQPVEKTERPDWGAPSK